MRVFCLADKVDAVIAVAVHLFPCLIGETEKACHGKMREQFSALERSNSASYVTSDREGPRARIRRVCA